MHNLSSQRKNGSGQVRKSLDSDQNNRNANVQSSHQIMRPNSSVFEIEDYKNLIRNTGQAQTSRNGESSFKMSNKNMDKFISEPVICMDGAVRPTRNQNNKVSKSSNEVAEIKNKKHIMRQPSLGQVDYQNRQKFI